MGSRRAARLGVEVGRRSCLTTNLNTNVLVKSDTDMKGMSGPWLASCVVRKNPVNEHWIAIYGRLRMMQWSRERDQRTGTGIYDKYI